jgi:hypothetical protein
MLDDFSSIEKNLFFCSMVREKRARKLNKKKHSHVCPLISYKGLVGKRRPKLPSPLRLFSSKKLAV